MDVSFRTVRLVLYFLCERVESLQLSKNQHILILQRVVILMAYLTPQVNLQAVMMIDT